VSSLRDPRHRLRRRLKDPAPAPAPRAPVASLEDLFGRCGVPCPPGRSQRLLYGPDVARDLDLESFADRRERDRDGGES
jgi:hypothetical protein